jgi:predicted metal-dependent hydrolase
MPILSVGKIKIPFEIRRSAKSRNRRIVVTPDKVEVVAPTGDKDDEILTFVHSRRRWIYEKREVMVERMNHSINAHPERFVTGAKILYRGRRMRLAVQTHQNSSIKVEYKNGFLIHRPVNCSDIEVKEAIEEWLKERIRNDIESSISIYSKKIGATPKGLRIGAFKHLWGSCGKKGIINLNWQLIFAPKSVLEYSVVHELCHLQYRNHSNEFWSRVKSILPDYELRKNWLDRNEHLLETNQKGIGDNFVGSAQRIL